MWWLRLLWWLWLWLVVACWVSVEVEQRERESYGPPASDTEPTSPEH